MKLGNTECIINKQSLTLHKIMFMYFVTVLLLEIYFMNVFVCRVIKVKTNKSDR